MNINEEQMKLMHDGYVRDRTPLDTIISYMKNFTVLIKMTLVPLLLGVQSCNKQEVKPTPTVGEVSNSSSKVVQQMQSAVANSKIINGGYEKRTEKIPLVKASSTKNNQNVTLLKIREETCYDVYQTYIDVNSGEIVGRRLGWSSKNGQCTKIC